MKLKIISLHFLKDSPFITAVQLSQKIPGKIARIILLERVNLALRQQFNKNVENGINDIMQLLDMSSKGNNN